MTETSPPPNAGMERAVEAALPIIRTARCGSNELNWCDAGMDCRCRVATTTLITTADRARGRPSGKDVADRIIRTLREHDWSVGMDGPDSLSTELRQLIIAAWAERPAAPDTLARTATDDAAPAHADLHPPSTHETPGAAVLAGGAIAVDRVERPPFKFTDDTEPTFEDRITTLEQGGVDTQKELLTQGARILALERRSEWTEEKNGALAYAIVSIRALFLREGLTIRADETDRIGKAAFPEPGA